MFCPRLKSPTAAFSELGDKTLLQHLEKRERITLILNKLNLNWQKKAGRHDDCKRMESIWQIMIFNETIRENIFQPLLSRDSLSPFVGNQKPFPTLASSRFRKQAEREN